MDNTAPGSLNMVKELIKQKSQFKSGELEEKLASLGSAAIPDLLEVVRSNYQNMAYACAALARIGDPSMFEPLFSELNKVQDPKPVAKALSKIVDKSHVDKLLDLLSQGKYAESRGGAALVLGALVAKGVDAALKDRILQALLQAFQVGLPAGFPYIRYTNFLIEALGTTRDPLVLDTLISWMDGHPSVEVDQALGNFTDDRAVQALISQLTVPKLYKDSCIESLGRTGSRKAVAPLLEVLNNKEEYRNHKAAVKALSKLGDTSAVEALINCLMTEEEYSTRAEAANALGLLKDARAVDALKKAQTDQTDYVREAATNSLALFGVHAAPPKVLEPPKIMGILVLSHGEVANKSSLLWEISIQQGQLGHERASSGVKEVVLVAGESFSDMAYVYASIRSNFSDLGDLSLEDRTYSYDFKASDGNYGNYYVIFTRPK